MIAEKKIGEVVSWTEEHDGGYLVEYRMEPGTEFPMYLYAQHACDCSGRVPLLVWLLILMAGIALWWSGR